MILKPGKKDLRAIGYYLGKIIIGFSLTMVVPILVGLAVKEISPVLIF